MMPASTRGIGMAVGFPDVCNTPTPAGPVPIPYPNISDHSSASSTVTNVRINMLDALNQMSQVPMTTGDEAGSAHSTIKGAQKYTLGMINIRFNMMPAITLACLTNHNNQNCPIGLVAVPSAPNVLINRAVPSGAIPRASVVLSEVDAADIAHAVAGASMRESFTDGRGFAWIVCEAFPLAAGAELADVVHRALERGATGLAIDLGGCRGGVLKSAIDAASLFLPKGLPIVSVVDADGDVTEHRSRGGPFESLPLEILVGAGTASAAEVFAGALSEHGRAQIAGTRTHGKGTVYETCPTGDGRMLAVPAGVTKLPSGRAISDGGVR